MKKTSTHKNPRTLKLAQLSVRELAATDLAKVVGGAGRGRNN